MFNVHLPRYSGILSGKVRHSLMLLALLFSASLMAADATTPASESDKTIMIGTGDWPPYVDETRPDAGAMGRLISAIFARAGYKVQYFFYPWDRDLYLLRKGELDAVMPYVCSQERQVFSLCGKPLVRSQIVLFHRKDKAFDWKQFSDIQPYLIAVTQGYFYSNDFSKARDEGLLKLEQSSLEYRGIQLLLADRADLHPQDRAVGYNLLKKNFDVVQQGLLTHHPKPLAENQLSLLFRKDPRGKQLRKAFEAAVRPAELKTLQRALDSGAADNWQPSAY